MITNDLKIELASESKFGGIKSAELQVQAILAPATWQIKEVSTTDSTIKIKLDGRITNKIRFNFDEPASLIPHKVYLLPVAINYDDRYMGNYARLMANGKDLGKLHHLPWPYYSAGGRRTGGSWPEQPLPACGLISNNGLCNITEIHQGSSSQTGHWKTKITCSILVTNTSSIGIKRQKVMWDGSFEKG
jgi:hypothetical protein